MLRSRFWRPALLVGCAALGAPAVASARTAFSGGASVHGVQAVCVADGTGPGRVVIEAHVRYAGPKPAAAKRYAGGRHRVESSIAVLDARGRTVVRDTDRGSAARVSIPGRSSHEHVHKHALGRAASRALLQGRGCRAASSTVVGVRVRARQTLSASARVARVTSASSDGQTATALASAAPSASQTAAVTASAVVTPGDDAPVVNGCRLVGMDTNCHGSDLQGARLSGSDLPYSDFSFASMVGSDLSAARLGHVIMNWTVLTGANLGRAQLGSASLTSALLDATDLTGAALPFANLGNARFTDARLEDANLIAANLHGTTFVNTSCNDGTLLPAVFPFRCVAGLVTAP